MDERLRAMAAGIGDAIEEREARVIALEAELAALEGKACTGREGWIDKDHPTKKPKLKILHSIDQACPLHGKPKPGGRLRPSVGCDPERIAEARAAMALLVHQKEVSQRLGAVRRALSNCEYSISRFYRDLGFDVQADGEVVSRW